MDWTAGYVSDIEYTAGFHQELSPSYLNFVCVVNGFEPVPLNKPFTYFELGCGRGLITNLLAATNPLGKFYATDFMPSHIAEAQELAASAQSTNMVFLEDCFEDLAAGKTDLPQFDFITLHGIYTWVSRENRQHIVNFIARYLKPGGIVYVSYNAMPGWTTILPLHRMLLEHSDLHPGRSDAQLAGAVDFIMQLNAAQGTYFTANPSLQAQLGVFTSSDPHYLVHEYMNQSWEPLYHADVVKAMADAKLDYIGAAEPSYAYPELYLTQEKQALLAAIPNPVLRETAKDYLLNTSFRKDLFVRGARRINMARQAELLSTVGLALVVPRDQVSLTLKTMIGEVTVMGELYNPVLDALAKQPHTLMELYALPGLSTQTPAGMAQIASLLMISGQASIYFTGNAKAAIESSHKMNRALAAHARFGDEYLVLTSPLLGNGIAADYIELLVYLHLSQFPKETDAAAIARHAWHVMAGQGRLMVRDGQVLESPDANIAELSAQIRPILANKLPIWRQLKVL